MVVLSASNENLIYCIDLSNFWGTLQVLPGNKRGPGKICGISKRSCKLIALVKGSDHR